MSRNVRSAPIITLLVTLLMPMGVAWSAEDPAATALPRQPQPFTGKLGPTEADSEGMAARRVRAPEGAPNILLVMTDDVGFASVSTFGGPAPKPNLDDLAQQGLRYNRFHTTSICSPTRASLLTGRNHHAVGLGTLSDIPSPYPGYTGRIPPTAATVARLLRDNGYNTAMFGKDHNIPGEERSPSGPFDQWPIGRGFEYFYGFIAGDTDQYLPAIYEGITPVKDADRPDDYLWDEEMADKAINWIHNQKGSDPDKPFFIYYAPGTAHAPHQAPPEWIEKFRGKFDHGWDRERDTIFERQKEMGIIPEDTRLPERPDVVPAWDSLSDKEQKVYARFMEVYTAMLAYQDYQFGRIMDELERMGIADNTLVVYLEGDNGSSAEGGATGSVNEMADLSSGTHGIPVDWLAENLDAVGSQLTYQGYQNGWTYATNTPFPWFKQHASHLGGVRNGLVISWPDKIKRGGEIRSQYHHVIDIMPTLLEAAGVEAPTAVDGIEQQPIDGTSMVYSFSDGDAASPRTTQYYENLGNRAIYHNGWLASTTPRNMPWDMPVTQASDVTTYPWELYNLDEDFSQSLDLADRHPDKLAELQAVFDAEARANKVYPIHDMGGQARGMRMARFAQRPMRTEYVYWGRDIHVQMGSAPPIFFLPFSVEADVEISGQGGEGVILAAGSKFGGWSFYLQDGKPVAYSSVSGLPLPGNQSKVTAARALAPGKHRITFDFSATQGPGGKLTISVDGTEVASGDITKRPRMLAGNGETFDTGRDSNVSVSPDYHREGVFSGAIERVKVKVKMPSRGGAH